MKIKKVTLRTRVGTDVSKPAPVACDVSAQYAAVKSALDLPLTIETETNVCHR